MGYLGWLELFRLRLALFETEPLKNPPVGRSIELGLTMACNSGVSGGWFGKVLWLGVGVVEVIGAPARCCCCEEDDAGLRRVGELNRCWVLGRLVLARMVLSLLKLL